MLPEDEILKNSDKESDPKIEQPYINRSQRLDAVISRNFALIGCFGFAAALFVGFIYTLFIADKDSMLGQVYSGWGF